MHGYDVVTSEDEKIGTVVEERDNCLVVEHGHVFKARNAVPREFAHVDDEAHLVRLSVAKAVFDDSPKVDDAWTCEVTHEHYGLVGHFERDPDPNDPATTTDADPTTQRAAMREGGTGGPPVPAVRERQANAYDPAGDTANLH